jgi:protein TonB
MGRFEWLQGEGEARRGLFFPVSLLVHAAAVCGFLALSAFSPSSLPIVADKITIPILTIPSARAEPALPRHVGGGGGGGVRTHRAPAPPVAEPTGTETRSEPSEDEDGARPCLGCDVGLALPGGDGPPGPASSGSAGPRVVRVSEVHPPRKVKDRTPIYPPLALVAHVQGIVMIECTIDPDGRVSALKLLKGVPLLSQAALDAVQDWVYTPTLLDGVPVSVIMTVTVNFINGPRG